MPEFTGIYSSQERTSLFLENSLTIAVLAGGAGRRFGGIDKGWLSLQDQPLVERLLALLQPQAATLMIVANRNLDRYRALGIDVVSDATPGHEGPLAGLVAARAHAASEWLLTVPVDAVLPPPDFAARMLTACGAAGRCGYVQSAAGPQPVCALLRRCDEAPLRAAFERGERSPRAWLASRDALAVDFSDWPQENWSLNTPEELVAWEQRSTRALK